VLAASPGRALAHSRVALAHDPRPPGLHFEPTRHHVWTDDAGDVILALWQGGLGTPGTDCERWFDGRRGIVASTGALRWSGRPWAAEASWAREIDRELERRPLRELVRDLRGVFTIVDLHADGTGEIATDPLGFSFVFHGRADACVAVSSRAALCALACAGAQARPRRDLLASCWPAYSRHWIGLRTGYEDVRLVPPGARVVLTRDRELRVETEREPWMPPDELRDLTTEHLLDAAYEDLADTVRATVTLPGGEYRADLTGGKDSRLIASLVMSERLTDQFVFQTFGPPTLADVQVASRVAERFGLRHERRFDLPPAREYPERARAFIRASSGMTNLWTLKEPREAWPEIRATGVSGLLLRSKAKVSERASSEEDLVRALDSMRFGATDVLRPETRAALRAATLDELLDPTVGGTLMDRFDSFDLRASQRHLLGLLEELETDIRIKPLASHRAVNVAYALGGAARAGEAIHLQLIRRHSEALCAFPFAGEKWRRPPADLTLDPTPPITGDTTPAASAPGAKDESLVARMQRTSFVNRADFFREVLSDGANPAWDVIDRTATLGLVERFEALNAMQRVEVFGAIGAAIWIGEDLGV